MAPREKDDTRRAVLAGVPPAPAHPGLVLLSESRQARLPAPSELPQSRDCRS